MRAPTRDRDNAHQKQSDRDCVYEPEQHAQRWRWRRGAEIHKAQSRSEREELKGKRDRANHQSEDLPREFASNQQNASDDDREPDSAKGDHSEGKKVWIDST